MSAIHQVIDQFPGLTFQEQVMLAPYTYMKVGGPAALYSSVTTADDLYALSSYCCINKIPFVVMGGASNVIIPDEGLQKLVIRNQSTGITMTPQGDATLVRAESGVITAVLANRTMEQHLTGLEYFIGVPGTIGGAIVNNSHFTAHDLIGNLVTEVEVCTKAGQRQVWSHEKLKFGYDYSIFHEELGIVLAATFKLRTDTEAAIRERVQYAATKRTQTQPIGVPSSGCMYKNVSVTGKELARLQQILTIPESAIKQLATDLFTVAAGFLIDQAGLKGKTVGGAQVSEKHATYMINTGTATAHDVEALAQIVEQTVQEKFGVSLEREVFFLH